MGKISGMLAVTEGEFYMRYVKMLSIYGISVQAGRRERGRILA